MTNISLSSDWSRNWRSDHIPTANEPTGSGTVELYNPCIVSTNNDIYMCVGINEETPNDNLVWKAIALTRVFNNNVSRSLGSNYTVSTTRDAQVSYSINVSWTLQALISGNATAFLEYSTNGGSTWITVNQVSKTLQLLSFAGSDDLNITGVMPANALARIRVTSTNMTVTYVRGQEVLL